MKKDIKNEKFLEWALNYDKQNHKGHIKNNMKPFETLFFEVGAEILKNVKGFMAANPDKSVQSIRKKLKTSIENVKASGDKNKREEFLNEIRESVEVAKRINARWMTVVPGYKDLRLDLSYQTVNVTDSLKYACEILEPHGLVMVLEPLNFLNHPGLFLTESPQAYEICKSVGSSSCKILFDIYHQQIQEGNLIPNIEKCWDEIGYFQIGDNPGRNEPTTGEINYTNVFKYIHSRGFNGILGMEHGNSRKDKAGEQAVIDAYVKVDQFI